MFYIPNLPYACYLAIKAKSPVFFSIANPGIKSSGNGTESKFKTLNLVPEKYKPKSVLATPKCNFKDIINSLHKTNINFPLIAKPDVGFRGLLVKKIKNKEALKIYLDSYKINIIIQEYIDYTNECGVFYHRNPNEKKGTVSSITLKKFISVLGDGVSSLKTLILKDKRASLYITLFESIYNEEIHRIPKKNEKVQLTDIGNHSKGTQFINGNHLISEQLTNTFDLLSESIEGWFYGRVDIKYNNFKDLENGNDLKILEINGIISEPTHIYDKQNNSYLKALKTIRNHWKSIYNISKTNHTDYNIPYKKTKVFIQELITLKRYTNLITKI